MGKIDNYSYARTLQFFEAYYPYDTEDVHYADVMLSMNHCKSIDELLSIRERLNNKADDVCNNNTYILYKLPDNLLDKLSIVKNANSPLYNSKIYRVKTNIEFDVNSCYDENIVRLLRIKEQITDTFCGECFVNSSNCSTISNIKEQIIKVAKEKANLDVAILLEEIAKRYKAFFEHLRIYNNYKKGMNGYYPAKQLVADDYAYLIKYKWRKASSYQEFLPEQIIREERNEEREKNSETKSIVIGVTVIIAIIVGLGIWMESFEAGLILFIIICAVIKLYADLFKH